MPTNTQTKRLARTVIAIQASMPCHLGRQSGRARRRYTNSQNGNCASFKFTRLLGRLHNNTAQSPKQAFDCAQIHHRDVHKHDVEVDCPCLSGWPMSQSAILGQPQLTCQQGHLKRTSECDLREARQGQNSFGSIWKGPSD